MFTTQDVLCALTVGLLVGGFMGAAVWELLVAQPARRRERHVREQLTRARARHYTAGWKADAVYHATGCALDNDRWSRKTPLEVVR